MSIEVTTEVGQQSPLVDPEAWVAEVLKSSDQYVLFLYVRSYDWCPFCKRYLTELAMYGERIRASGGRVYVFSSDSQELADHAKKTWGIPESFELYGDPTHVFQQYLKKNNMLDIVITTTGLHGHQYKHGYAQPGMLVLTKEKEMMFRWAINPTIMNLGGAKDRPKISQIVELIENKLSGKVPMTKSVDARDLGKMGVCDLITAMLKSPFQKAKTQ